MRILLDPFKSENKLCAGCSILDKQKPCHSIIDHDEQAFNRDCEILFVSESFKVEFGEVTPFPTKEQELIEDTLSSLGMGHFIPKVEYTASVKCPSVKERDMTKEDKDICRQHLTATLKACKPKVIFTCGNQALVMLMKKSGIMGKRGKTFYYDDIPVVPIFHPAQVLIEPQNKYLFQLDIQSGIENHCQKIESKSDFIWSLVDTPEKLTDLLKHKDCDISVDIETTGLDFIKDEIQTIAITVSLPLECQYTYVIPMFHKDFTHPENWANKVAEVLNQFFENENTRKIFHKAQFDTKFLARQGMKNIQNIFDTKIMQHMIDENLPKSLKDLVSYYFPNELGVVDARA